ncbi:MAG: type II toxin-antitoxin system VapC family toxin [Candidatus Nanopelagicales bacterium]
MPEVFYLDSSVAIHVLIGTPPAVKWFDQRVDAGDRLVSSQLLELEVRRFLRRERMAEDEAGFLSDSLYLMAVDDYLLREAARIVPVLNTLDCLHLASATRIGAELVTLATHDRSLASASATMGFTTVDPLDGA